MDFGLGNAMSDLPPNPKSKIQNSSTQHSITPILHNSNYPLTYSASASRQCRIGASPNRSDNKQRSGV